MNRKSIKNNKKIKKSISTLRGEVFVELEATTIRATCGYSLATLWRGRVSEEKTCGMSSIYKGAFWDETLLQLVNVTHPKRLPCGRL